MEPKQRGTPGRAFRSLLCVALAFCITGFLGTTVFFRDILEITRKPEAQPVLSQQELDALHGITWEGGVEPAMQPDGVKFGTHDLSIGGSGIVNILLIGQDRRPDQGRARSDSMILCTFQKATGKLILTSFLRDLYVEIPGYRANRINAAYEAGGMTLLDETLRKNFGIRVDGNVEVDFSQFAQIMDLLGGVPLEIREDEAREISRLVPGSDLHGGTVILTGEQALHYARIRTLDQDSDFSRTQRQRKVLTAVLDQYRDRDLGELLRLVPEILPMVSTDLTRYQIFQYAGTLLPMLKDLKLESQRIPAPGCFEDRTIRGMAVLVADMDRTRALLQESLLPPS